MEQQHKHWNNDIKNDGHNLNEKKNNKMLVGWLQHNMLSNKTYYMLKEHFITSY